MGMFDTYEDIQLKVGNPQLRQYEVGDFVGIPDGAYFNPGEGVVIIKNGDLIATVDKLFDYWGEEIVIPD